MEVDLETVHQRDVGGRFGAFGAHQTIVFGSQDAGSDQRCALDQGAGLEQDPHLVKIGNALWGQRPDVPARIALLAGQTDPFEPQQQFVGDGAADAEMLGQGLRADLETSEQQAGGDFALDDRIDQSPPVADAELRLDLAREFDPGGILAREERRRRVAPDHEPVHRWAPVHEV